MNNHCLFCTQRSSTLCCLGCRERDRSTIFEVLLTLLGKASTTIHHYDRIKAVCQQIETVSLMLLYDLSCIKL